MSHVVFTRTGPIWLALALLLGVASPASTQEERPTEHAYSEGWNGLFLGVGAHGGPATLANEPVAGTWGWAAGAKLSGAVILNTISVQLDYLHSEFNTSVDGDAFDASLDGVGVSLNFHPGFLLNMYGAGLGYIAAAFYIQFGVSAEFTSIEWRDQSLDESWDIAVHLGGGIDVPITSADAANSLWLGFNYRWNDVPVVLESLDATVYAEEDDLRQHLLLFRVTLRNKGLPF